MGLRDRKYMIDKQQYILCSTRNYSHYFVITFIFFFGLPIAHGVLGQGSDLSAAVLARLDPLIHCARSGIKTAETLPIPNATAGTPIIIFNRQ